MKFLAILLALAVTAGAAERQSLKHKHIPAAVAGLIPIGDLEPTRQLHLSIGLSIRNQAKLDALLNDLNNPSSPSYRHWLSVEQTANLFGPTEQEVAAVEAYALKNGLKTTRSGSHRLVIGVDGPVSAVERAFGVKMKRYHHIVPREDREFYAPDREPTLDGNYPVVDISGLNNFYRRVPTWHPDSGRSTTTGSGTGGTYAGYDFRRAYVPGTPLTGVGQNVGIVSYYDFNASDIVLYRNATGLPSITIQTIYVGTGSSGGLNIEPDLDICMDYAMAPGSTIYFFNGLAGCTDAQMFNAIASYPVVKQCSYSYTYEPPAANSEHTDPTCESIFQILSAQGQTVFVSSGDEGAYYEPWGACWPAASPNVCTVGGTSLTMNGAGVSYASETTWNDGAPNYTATGGGYSIVQLIPSWQVGISMASNYGSTTHRNAPDVAMVAANILVYYNGVATTVEGTSAATPLWCGLCALINQQALSLGKPTVGFINNGIYTLGKSSWHSSCFHDITVGNNFSPTEYPAVAGYDLCTGWGTPNGTNLINALYTGPAFTSLVFSNGLFIKATSP
jgi:subtilase family serine protease